MKLNPKHPGTYTGQEVRLCVAVETSSGRRLFALRTASGAVATAWDSPRELIAYAKRKYLKLTVE